MFVLLLFIEAGILALEYTKNEINTPIPDRLVKSFLTTSQQYNNDTSSEKDNDFDSKSLTKGLKRLKRSQTCSKKFKYTESSTYKKSEFENLLDQLSPESMKTFPRVYNSRSNFYQNSSIENNLIKNKEVCNKNQLVCLNSETDIQLKWIENLISLLNKKDNSDMENKSFGSTS